MSIKKTRPHFQRADRLHGCLNHVFAVYHYLLDSATATSATTNRRIYSLTVIFNSAARLTIISWSLSETFICMCLFFTFYLSTRYDASGRAVQYLINSTDSKAFQAVVANFSFIVTTRFNLLYRVSECLSSIKHLYQLIIIVKEYSTVIYYRFIILISV